MSERREGFRLTKPHVPGCIVADRYVSGRFTVHRGVSWHLNKYGTGRGSTAWHHFACNDIDCDAEMLVRWDVLVEFIDPAQEGEADREGGQQ